MRELLDWLFPRPCVACGELLRGRGGELGLCPRCSIRCRALEPGRSCCRCGEPVPAGTLCAPCAIDPPPFSHLVALWQYQTPVRELVHAFKFRRLDYLGEALGREMGRALLADLRVAQMPDLVVPMPLAWTRRLARGYNQTEILAPALAREIGRPVRRVLSRGIARGHQTGRSRQERLRALLGRGSGGRAHPIRLRRFRHRAVAGRCVLLVDDVITTGATARAATQALLDGGASAVMLAVIARTPSRVARDAEPGRQELD